MKRAAPALRSFEDGARSAFRVRTEGRKIGTIRSLTSRLGRSIVESVDQQLNRYLEILRGGVGGQAPGDLLGTEVAELLGRDGIAAALVERVAALKTAAVDSDAIEIQLLDWLLDEARRAREDDRANGARFIAAAEEALDELDTDAIGDAGLTALGLAWYRAGLETPEALRALQAASLAAEPAGELADPDAAAAAAVESLQELREQCGDDAHTLSKRLGETLATLPDDAAYAFIHTLNQLEQPVWLRVGLFWLLDPKPAYREAAAEMFRALAEQDRMPSDVAGQLGWVRAFLPAGEARKRVDSALGYYRQRQREWPQMVAMGRFDTAYASIPDGAGAQYIVLAAATDGTRSYAMILIKAGYGVRDAYVLGELDEAEEDDFWETLVTAGDMRPVPQSAVTALIGAATAENVERGEPPAPGLLDVAATTDLTNLRPAWCSGRQWLAELDPDDRLRDLSAQKLGRLINRAREWLELDAMATSWFEDTAEVRALLARGGSRQQRARRLRQHLEGRREWWAELCLRAALTTDGTDKNSMAECFTATGAALLDGRELKRIPVMEYIVMATLDAHEPHDLRRGFAAPPTGARKEALADDDELPELAIVQLDDPERARLQPLFDRYRDAPEGIGGYFGLHGFLFAVATQPDLVTPSRWINRVLQALGSDVFDSADEAEVEGMLGDIAMLHNRINDHVIDTQPALPAGCDLVSPAHANVGPEAPIGQWAIGFSRARELLGHFADRSFGDPVLSPELTEAVAVASNMIEFLAWGRSAAREGIPKDLTFNELAEGASESFKPNLFVFCIGRQLVQAEDDDPEFGAAQGHSTDPVTGLRDIGDDPFADPLAGDPEAGAYPPDTGETAATKPRGPTPEKKKHKRKQQQKARKKNRKRR